MANITLDGLFDYDIRSLLLDDDEEEEEEESRLLKKFKMIRKHKFLFNNNNEDNILFRLLIDYYGQCQKLRNPVHTLPIVRHQVVHNMFNSHFRNYFYHCRMLPKVFLKLCAIFKERDMLVDSCSVTIE